MSGLDFDIEDVYLPGEESDSVPVFDTCDEIRRKINVHLRKHGVTQAKLCRDICSQYHSAHKPANIQAVQLTRFRSAKGPTAGTKSIIFYGAYVLFEKIRVKQGKHKSKHRMEMEALWPSGIGMTRDSRTTLALPHKHIKRCTDHNTSRRYWASSSAQIHQDKYGRVQISVNRQTS